MTSDGITDYKRHIKEEGFNANFRSGEGVSLPGQDWTGSTVEGVWSLRAL